MWSPASAVVSSHKLKNPNHTCPEAAHHSDNVSTPDLFGHTSDDSLRFAMMSAIDMNSVIFQGHAMIDG